MSRYLLRFRDQWKARSGQHRRMQRLANGASRLGSFSMLVEKRQARDDVQQRHAAQDGQGLLCEPSMGCGLPKHADTTVRAA